MSWTIIETKAASAEENMCTDAALLENLGAYQDPILHLYEWERPSVTYGLLTNPLDFLKVEEAKKWGIDLAKRPTGGGIIFHLWDYAFSVLVPASSPYFSENTLENYAFINNRVLDAIKNYFSSSLELISSDAVAKDPFCERFCMAKPTKYDVVFQGKKVAGAAQRRTKNGFLHQGSIALCLPNKEVLSSVLYQESLVMEAMFHYSCPLINDEACSVETLEKVKKELKNQLTFSLTRGC